MEITSNVPSNDVATVSETIGEGLDAHRIVRVGSWELKAWAGEEEPRIRDLDLAARLEYKEHRAIRKLIKRYATSGDLPDVFRRDTVSRRGIFEETIEEYWLREEEALFIATRSETKAAIALTKEMIRVYFLARRGLLPQQTTGLTRADVTAMLQEAIEPLTDFFKKCIDHPDRFLPRAELRDHGAECEDCKKLISRAAQINGVHFQAIHAEILKNYQLRSYKRMPWTLWESAREYLFDRIMNPINSRVIKTGPLQLIHESIGLDSKIPNITPVAKA